jgi:hypothetical protein
MFNGLANKRNINSISTGSVVWLIQRLSAKPAGKWPVRSRKEKGKQAEVINVKNSTSSDGAGDVRELVLVLKLRGKSVRHCSPHT